VSIKFYYTQERWYEARSRGGKACRTLTDEQVREIRRLREEECWTFESIANKYRKSITAIRDICQGRSYTEVE
jgi:hypothetical protein